MPLSSLESRFDQGRLGVVECTDMSSVSTVDHLISNGLAVIKDTRFDQRAQQGARRPSQLAYCGPIGECRNLHIAVHVEPTLEFTIRVSYTNASTGEPVHVPLPPPSLVQVPPVVANMLDCGKLMLCGHSVSVHNCRGLGGVGLRAQRRGHGQCQRGS